VAKSRGTGDWLVLEEKLERGDASFVDDLRSFHDAEVLGGFAARWLADKRPASRRMLLEYLDRPLNAFRHEALVKRLFKAAEAAGDDEVMARFMVLFDRSVRREEWRRLHMEWAKVKTEAEAQKLMTHWRGLGFDSVQSFQWERGTIQIRGDWYEPRVRTPSRTAMPRDELKYRNPRTGEPISDILTRLLKWFGNHPEGGRVPPRVRKLIERLRLFSVTTRQYLRRRAWRYFRRMGKTNPERYVAAVSQALEQYTDQDVSDGLALIDNWGLMHALFHRSEILVANGPGWAPVDGHTLAELSPAPIYERLWEQAPRALVELLLAARCRPVRQWAVQMIRRHDGARAAIKLDELIELLAHEDSEVAALAIELFREKKSIGTLAFEQWLELVEEANPSVLDTIALLLERFVDPERLSLAQVVRLARSRVVPAARMGLKWLSNKVPLHAADDALLLGLTEAECEPLRGQIVRLVCDRLRATGRFDSSWVLEFLDSRHGDVRAAGIEWFRSEPRARDDVTIWRRLMESPYDDVRLFLISELESRVAGRDVDRAMSLGLDSEALRLLWASVLLNIQRGGRAKPTVVRQLVRAIKRRPADAGPLLPILAVALRSCRGPERRAGLQAVAELAEGDAHPATSLSAIFPELKLL
jgi:hypothetical protein